MQSYSPDCENAAYITISRAIPHLPGRFSVTEKIVVSQRVKVCQRAAFFVLLSRLKSASHHWSVTPPALLNAHPVLAMTIFGSTIRFARASTVLAVAALSLATACSTDSTLAPEVAPKHGLIGDLVGGVKGLLIPMKALTRDVAMAPMTRSFTFDRSGGKIEIAEAGLRVDIPAGAIPGKSLTITVTVLPGKSVAYDFQPHGTKFLKALEFRQDLKGTSWDDSAFKGTLTGGYFKDRSQLDLRSGIALLDELFPILVKTHEARFNINHFSGYMVSSGRSGRASVDEDAF